MRTWLIAAALAAGSALVASPSMSASILDTGTINSSTITSNPVRAAQFTVTNQTIITGLERYTGVTQTNTGNVQFSIYTDSSNLPGSMLAGRSVAGSITQGSAAWFAVGDLNWAIGPGTYWLVFEALPGPNFPVALAAPFCPDISGNDSGAFDPACIAAPVSREAGRAIGDDVWGVRSARTGWRINGRTVPEPGTFALLGLGLVGLGAARRKRSH